MNATQLYFGRRIFLFSNDYIGYRGSGRFRWSGGDGGVEDGCIGGDSAGHGVNSWSCEVGRGVTKTSTY